MGTDIHLFTERRASATAPWEVFKAVVLDCDDCPKDGRVCYWCKGAKKLTGYRDRNYDVFAMLANVRNGTGFAGIKTGSGFQVIASPRGLPADLSPKLSKLLTWWDGPKRNRGTEEEYEALCNELGRGAGDHTPSWLTLAELLAFPIDDQRSVLNGIITAKQFTEWDGATAMYPYCVDISGPGVEAVTPLAAKNGAKHSHVAIEWVETYRQAGGRFWDFVEGLKQYGEPENVRIVFNFDS